MIQTFQRTLPHGITLSCRAAGDAGRPLMVFLHGFPEGAFIWDPLLEYFSQPEHGGYRCVAPNLRGFEQSSSPPEVEAYRAHLLVKDILELAALESPDGRIDTLVAHDWGGAFGWGLANAQPGRLKRLVIINSPHPGTFLRELRDSPAQQASSAYMTFLSRPDAEELLSANDYQRLWPFLTMPEARRDWLTEEVKAQYREVWGAGLTGACNLYRVTPLKPAAPGEGPKVFPDIPRERLVVEVPTLVLWALDDVALLPGLLDGLEDYVPKMQLRKVPGATHWIVHERPDYVAREIEAFARST
ncbi:alpha/beta fold hydrolase [Variovorax sp. OV329]|uniref:alpha/beta fold hydrolase n=1 Tax=Variovorax sp. OV329 TaxID=1882825 RepID=UPI0008F124EB|nr:alpha/beta fold hydrolase [Variovorax sp. OV329]SFM18901.1 Pimeloyl-ACP methyl ester carboxylesterase [Variovorax sp. OV329]